ncbi:MAG: glycosyltransferase family 1 protein, partial [Bacteroidales bacterium]|nr:glycosyltransferase family 1 protein [Bacteroidales bacterium]
PNFHIVVVPSAPYPIWEQFSLPIAVRKAGCQLLHCTSNTAPIFTSVPLIVTLHDIIFMESLSLLKKGFSAYQKFGNMYRRFVVPLVVKKSKQIITVSEFEKKRIGDFFHIKDEKLHAIYNGVSNHFKPIDNKEELERIKEKYKLPDKFFFFFGNTDPKKNTAGVLKALSLFLQSSDKKIPLVMLDFDRNELDKIVANIGDAELEHYIKLIGYVPNDELPAVYSLSTIFLYPSLRESFGIPMLEAMACGIPVITSNTSCMPEVGGTAALFIDPFKPEEIADAINKLLSDHKLCEKMIVAGFENARKFSWKTMAENVLHLYQDVENSKC